MRRHRTAKCYAGWCDNKPRKDSRFCSNKCAAEYCEELVAGNNDPWCVHCQDFCTDDSHYKECPNNAWAKAEAAEAA